MTWVDPEEIGAWAEIDLDGTIKSPSRLSFSSLTTLAECGELWRLTRGFKRPSNSWYANVGGSAIHDMTQLYDEGKAEYATLDEIKQDFAEIFEGHKAEYEGVELLPSGDKKLNELSWRGGPNGKDEKWWLRYGPLMIEAYIVWRKEQSSSFKIISIEHPFEQVIGGELVTGHIDRVEIHLPTGALFIRDVKSGDSGGYFQLAGYREGFYRETGMLADWGDLIKFRWVTEKVEVPLLDEEGNPVLYVRGEKKGQPKMTTEDRGYVQCFTSRPTDFTGYTTEYVENRYEMARKAIENGIFMPNARNNCRYCGVNEYCRDYGGDKGLTFPVKSVIKPREVVSETPSSSV